MLFSLPPTSLSLHTWAVIGVSVALLGVIIVGFTSGAADRRAMQNSADALRSEAAADRLTMQTRLEDSHRESGARWEKVREESQAKWENLLDRIDASRQEWRDGLMSLSERQTRLEGRRESGGD